MRRRGGLSGVDEDGLLQVVEDAIAIVEAADDESVDKQLRCFFRESATHLP